MVTMPSGYHNRFDASKNFDKWLFRTKRVVQGAELNEIQENSAWKLRQVSDVLFKDGAVVRDGGISIDDATGATALAAGVVYARGAMRGVAPRAVTIPVTGTVSLGVYLQDSLVTELEDPSLKDPAIGVRNNAEPGAARLKVQAVWGVAGDGTQGDYYGVYTVFNGVLQSTLPPPNVDPVIMGIAAYDRDSTGGHYISEGFRATALADDGNGQVYSLESGNARVGGRQVLISHAQRLSYPALPDLKQVVAEQQAATGGSQRIDLNHAPLASISQVLVTAQKTVSVQRGPVNGGSDLMPDAGLVSIVSVTQGGTTYVQGTDYVRSGDAVSWAPTTGGAVEPATGSTYTVVYRYIADMTNAVTGVDAKGFTVAGAVASTNVQITYYWKRPRIDRLCLDGTGSVVWVRGVPDDRAPRAPVVPDGLLGLASVSQTWTDVALTVNGVPVAARSVANDGIRVQTMPQLSSLEDKVNQLFAVVSEQQLKAEIALTDPTTKRGIFVDPFDSDDKRDQGVAQNAAIVAGALTLPAVNVTVLRVRLDGVQTLPLNYAGTYAVVSQTLKTGCMLVNPYMAFDPLPAKAVIVPATDFWTATENTWASPVTLRFTTEQEVIDRTSSLGWLTRELFTSREIVVSTATELVGTTTRQAEFLRQIQISFTVSGMGAGEVLQTVKFDGVSVAFA